MIFPCLYTQSRIHQGQAPYGLSLPLITGVIACLGLLLLTSWHLSVDPDTFMHLTVGQWILEHWAIPRFDIYSHSLVGQPWVAHEWLSELLFAVIYALGGWSALVLMTALSLACTLAILQRFLLKRVPPIYAVFFTALAYSALASHLLIRPHVLSWPLLVLWVSSLINASERQEKPSPYLLLIMIVWANLHGSFIFGLAIAIPLGAQALWVAPVALRGRLLMQWVVFWFMALLACLLTPLGIEGLLFPFSLFKLTHLNAIIEWMPYQFTGFGGLEIVIASYFLLALMGYVRISWINAIMIIGLLHQALTHNRYVSIFGLLTPLILARSFGDYYGQMQSSVSKPSSLDAVFERLAGLASKKAILICSLLILSVTFFSAMINKHEPSKLVVPVDAVNFSQSHELRGPVLNSYDFGGYLISRGIPVFIDGRADLYDEKVLGPYLEALRDGSKTALDTVITDFKIEWVLIRPNSPARDYFDFGSIWHKVYEDKTAVIFTRQSSKVEAVK